MNKKYTKEEYEINLAHQMADTEFLGRCGEILQMEVNERCSSHDSETEEMLSLYATDEQWKKHPMMYELIMGDGLDDDMFELIFDQTFYVGKSEKVANSEWVAKKTEKGEVVCTKVK